MRRRYSLGSGSPGGPGAGLGKGAEQTVNGGNRPHHGQQLATAVAASGREAQSESMRGHDLSR